MFAAAGVRHVMLAGYIERLKAVVAPDQDDASKRSMLVTLVEKVVMGTDGPVVTSASRSHRWAIVPAGPPKSSRGIDCAGKAGARRSFTSRIASPCPLPPRGGEGTGTTPSPS